MKLKDWDKSTLKKWEKLQTSQQEKLQTVRPLSKSILLKCIETETMIVSYSWAFRRFKLLEIKRF